MALSNVPRFIKMNFLYKTLTSTHQYNHRWKIFTPSFKIRICLITTSLVAIEKFNKKSQPDNQPTNQSTDQPTTCRCHASQVNHVNVFFVSKNNFIFYGNKMSCEGNQERKIIDDVAENKNFFVWKHLTPRHRPSDASNSHPRPLMARKTNHRFSHKKRKEKQTSLKLTLKIDFSDGKKFSKQKAGHLRTKKRE